MAGFKLTKHISFSLSAASSSAATLCRDNPCAAICLLEGPSLRIVSTRFASIFRSIFIDSFCRVIVLTAAGAYAQWRSTSMLVALRNANTQRFTRLVFLRSLTSAFCKFTRLLDQVILSKML